MQSTILFKEYGTILERDSQGSYYLSILCGTIAQFEITIILNSEEIERYEEWGDHFIQKLSLDISRDPDAFRSRYVKPA